MANGTHTHSRRSDWLDRNTTLDRGNRVNLGTPLSSGGPGKRPTHQQIADLAYSYWDARGRQGGSPQEDWLRAERELRERG